jgi:hypothetical protein
VPNDLPKGDSQIARVPFEEAVVAIRDWEPLADVDLHTLAERARCNGCCLNVELVRGILADVRGILQDALTMPVGRQGFRSLVNEVLRPHGGALTPAQADLLFETYIGHAFNEGKWRQFHKPELKRVCEFLGVDTAADAFVRPNHFALDYRRTKTVFRIDDLLWSVMRPPFGFKCRCTLMSFAKEDLQRLGLTVGRGADWYGKEVTVTVPMGQPQVVKILPDAGYDLKQADAMLVAIVLALATKKVTA